MAYNQNLTSVGLNTFTWIVPAAGPAFVKGKLSLPTVVGGGGPSQCVVTVNQNGTPIYTGLPGAEGFYVDFLGAVNDTITIVTSSSAAADQPINAVKMVISAGAGQ